MAIRNPSQDEIEKLYKKTEEVILKKDEINSGASKPNPSNVKELKNINPNKELIPKKSRFEPDAVKCELISGSRYVEDGYIYVRRLNTEEESKLSGINNSDTLNSSVNAIFETAIKSNVSIYEMPLIDKMYVFAFILGISYSDTIQVNDLINCKTCKDDYPYKISFLNDLKLEKLKEDISVPFKVTLTSFEDPHELCFNLPKIKNEKFFYNKDISEIISSITLYLRDKDGVDIPKEEWSDVMKWISNDDKKAITEILTNVNYYGENFNLIVDDKCKNPNCCMRGESVTFKIDDLFSKLIIGISS